MNEPKHNLGDEVYIISETESVVYKATVVTIALSTKWSTFAYRLSGFGSTLFPEEHVHESFEAALSSLD